MGRPLLLVDEDRKEARDLSEAIWGHLVEQDTHRGLSGSKPQTAFPVSSPGSQLLVKTDNKQLLILTGLREP